MALTKTNPKPIMLDLPEPIQVWRWLREGGIKQASVEKDWEFKDIEPCKVAETLVKPAKSKHQPFTNRD
jgi:hypothetical protein